jgi:segregation and condensation protein B
LDFLENHIEALIFCASEPITLKDLNNCLSEMLDAEIPNEDVSKALEKLMQKYDSEQFAFRIYRVAGGYRFKTKPEYHQSVATLLKQNSKKQLSKGALETLAIIAYKQPVTKAEVENIRGVGADYAIQKLLDKELIIITGKAETSGKPILYGTSPKFMEYFGLSSLDELPQPKDFAEQEEKEKSDGT